MKKIVYILTLMGIFIYGDAKQIDNTAQNISEIIIESQKKFTDTSGRPLPLAAGGTGELIDVYPHNKSKGYFFTPSEQLKIIEDGHHFLPTLGLYSYRSKALSNNYYDVFLKKLKAWGLPFTISTTQWEQDLYLDKNYFKLAVDKNPNFLNLDGKIETKLSPFTATNSWYELGKKWATETKLEYMQRLYPNPPRIIMLSNNEAKHLLFHEAESSKRFLSQYGKNSSSDFKKILFHKAWKEKYLALQSGIKQNITLDSWRECIKFIGYNVDSVNAFGRWYDWTKHNYFVPSQLGVANEYTYWDGGAVEYYLNPWARGLTDFTIFSPQIEYMNVKMSLDEIRQDKPNYWFEMFVWDGFETEHLTNPIKNKRVWFKSIGQEYSVKRYKGWLQFGMWLTQPRVVREFRGWAESREAVGMEYFEQVLDAVDVVYENPILKKFWRKGKLLKNQKHRHPYQSNIPVAYQEIPRWYLLDTSVDPKRPWSLKTELAVYALARSIKSDDGSNEWLIYAHAPKGNMDMVRIKIPDAKGGYLQEVIADIPLEGIFIYINAKGKISTF